MSDQPQTIYAVTGYIGPNIMRGEWSTRRDDEDRTTAEYVLKSTTDTRLADAEAMAEALRHAEIRLTSMACVMDANPAMVTSEEIRAQRDAIRAALEKWRAGK